MKREKGVVVNGASTARVAVRVECVEAKARIVTRAFHVSIEIDAFYFSPVDMYEGLGL